MSLHSRTTVIPAKAGIQLPTAVAPHWTPAFAGVTKGAYQ